MNHLEGVNRMTYGSVLLVSLIVPWGPIVEPAKSDYEKMQGKWQLRQIDHKRVNDKETYWVIEGDTVAFCDPGHAVGMLFKLYAGKNRKRIRLIAAPGWRPGDACFEGHYTLAADKLTITYRFKEGRGSQYWGENNEKDDNGPHTVILLRSSPDRH